MRKLLILTILCPLLSMCQPLSVKGKIINEASEPVAGATVTLKGSSASVQQTTANERGEFFFPATHLTDTLIISAVGYITVQEYNNERGLITVTLRRKIGVLDEAVIIAYGTTTRRLSTGNVTTVTAAEIERQPVSNPLAALQGRVPGLVITQTSGVAGSAFNIQLRGRTSLDLSLTRNDPLIIIDGVPFESGNAPANLLSAAFNSPYAVAGASPGGLSPLNSINPLDIESITVLKDADATAIYGSRGAAGVLLITTKKGRGGKTTTTVTITSGISRVATATPFLTTAQYLRLRREAFLSDGLVPTAANAPDLLLWDTTRYTNFSRLLTGSTAGTSNVQVSLSGGTATTRFTFSGGWGSEGNVFPGNFPALRFSSQLSISHAPLSGKWDTHLSVIYAYNSNHLPYTDLSRYAALPPNLRLYGPGGGLSWQEGGVNYSTLGFANPLADLERQYTAINKNLSANWVLNYHLFRGLVLRLSSGYNTFTSEEVSITPKAALAPENTTLAFSQFADAFRTNWIAEPQAEYTTTIGASKLQLLAGGTWQQRGYSNISVNGSNYTNDLLLTSIAAAGTVTATNGTELYRYAAAFGRINYNLYNKYLVNLSARRDGSSRFGPGRRMANFGAIGGAWVVSSEPWMQRAVPFISFGKLRASYGITGNDQVGDYRFLNLWTSTTNPYQGTPGLRPVALFNPDFEWEKNTKLETALDLGFWKGRFSLSAAWYRQRSSNQLITYRLPDQTGFASVVKNLPALVQNTGWELAVEGTVIRGKSVVWTTAANLTIPANKLVSFPGLAGSSYSSLYAEGRSLTVQTKLKFLGVDPATGLYSYEDVNKDGLISTPADLQVGRNLDPKFYGGFSNTVQYHNWQVDLFLQFVKQPGTNYLAYQYNTPPGFLSNQPTLVLDHWKAPGDGAPVQRYIATAASPGFITSYNLNASDAIFSDASFIRLKNVAVSYTLQPAVLKRTKIESAKIYLEAQNLATITRYRGGDPETQNLYQLPPLRTLVGGIRLIF